MNNQKGFIMNNTITPVNNVNFQAKLDVSKIKYSKERWQNIAKLFEKNTKKYPNDILEVKGSISRLEKLKVLGDDKDLAYNEVIVDYYTAKDMKKLSDKDFAQNLVDVFRYLKGEKKISKKVTETSNIKVYMDINLKKAYYESTSNVKFRDDDQFIKERPIFQDICFLKRINFPKKN